MKARGIAVWASVAGLALASCSTHRTETPQTWGGTVVGQVSKRAVVQNVDYRTRQVTVKDQNGDVTTVVAGPEVRNFNQINPGDKVALEYRETVTILAVSGVDTAPARAQTLDVTRAPLGQKPAGVIVQTGEAIAEVTAVNHKERSVTLKGPLRTVTVQAEKDAPGFARVKKGDRVYVRSTAAMAVAVTAD